jgi:hypothetical protein
LDADAHEFAWITLDQAELDTMTLNPLLKFSMGGNSRLVTFGLQTFAKGDIWLNVASRADSKTGDTQWLRRLKVEEGSLGIIEEDCGRSAHIGRLTGQLDIVFKTFLLSYLLEGIPLRDCGIGTLLLFLT